MQNGSFGGCSRMGGGQQGHLPKTCHTYSTLKKLGTVIPYLKKVQKIIAHVTHPFSSADISMSSPKISNFCYIKKCGYGSHFKNIL